MIDVLVIRLRIEYFLFGDRQIRELMLPRHTLTALVMHDAAVHSMYCLLFNYCIHSRGEYNKDIVAMLLLLCGGRILRGGLSITEVYTKCTARRTPARCK